MPYNLSSHLFSRIHFPFWDPREVRQRGQGKDETSLGHFLHVPSRDWCTPLSQQKFQQWNRKRSLCTFEQPQRAPMERKVFAFSPFSGPHGACQRRLQSQDPLSDSPSPLPCPDTIWDFLWKLKQSFAKWKPAHLGLCCPWFINKEGFLHPLAYKGPF